MEENQNIEIDWSKVIELNADETINVQDELDIK